MASYAYLFKYIIIGDTGSSLLLFSSTSLLLFISSLQLLFLFVSPARMDLKNSTKNSSHHSFSIL